MDHLEAEESENENSLMDMEKKNCCQLQTFKSVHEEEENDEGITKEFLLGLPEVLRNLIDDNLNEEETENEDSTMDRSDDDDEKINTRMMSDEEGKEDEDSERLDDEKAMKKLKDEIDEGGDCLVEDHNDSIDDNPIEKENEYEDRDVEKSGEDDEVRAKKRKLIDEEDLEDNDYDLIEESFGFRVKTKKQFKRFRSEDDDEDAYHSTGDNDQREASARHLFQSSDKEVVTHASSGGSSTREEPMESKKEEEEAYDLIGDDDGQLVVQEARDAFCADFDNFEKIDDSDYDEDATDCIVREGAEKENREKGLTKKGGRKSIFEVYELEKSKGDLFIDKDNEIRSKDVPERMQLRKTKVTPSPKISEESAAEVQWIFRHAFQCAPITNLKLKGAVKRPPKTHGCLPKIGEVLDLIRNHNYDVPFIAHYRKECTYPELDLQDLWKIYKFDEEWCLLLNRKNAMLKLFGDMENYIELEVIKNQLSSPDIRFLREVVTKHLMDVETMEQLKDVQSYFLLHYGHLVQAMRDRICKENREERRNARREERAQMGEHVEEDEDSLVGDAHNEPKEEAIRSHKSGRYTFCLRSGIGEFAKCFDLKLDQYAENVRGMHERNETVQAQVMPVEVQDSPLELAAKFCNEFFKTPQDVLKAAKFVVATQIAREPTIRKIFRDAYFQKATFNVEPTKKGIHEIGESHTCYKMKYLKSKPVASLKGVEFLRLTMAEQNKDLVITFDEDIRGVQLPSYLQEWKNLFCLDGLGNVAIEWNKLRQEAIEMAYKKILRLEIEKELRNKLVAEAKEYILQSCGKRLEGWLQVAPYTVDFKEKGWSAAEGLRILSIAYDSDPRKVAFGCLVSPNGDCHDNIMLPYLLKRKDSHDERERKRKCRDLETIKLFIEIKKPHVVCVGGETRDAMTIIKEIREIVTQLAYEKCFPRIPVELVDNQFSKVFANSVTGEIQFGEYPSLWRVAVSQGRMLRDPLLEYSQLCNSNEDILEMARYTSLRYHPLQDVLSQEELSEMITREFINRTNEVGVDVNQMTRSVYSGNLLQFVSGLGPRKAAELIEMLKQKPRGLENRMQLFLHCDMGPKIFFNCAGFIKIDTDSLSKDKDAVVEVLDSTRVHPEMYDCVRRMAMDALEYDDNEPNLARALEEILENPDKLLDFDLNAYVEKLVRQGSKDLFITYYDVREELYCRYKDRRVKYQPPDADRVFEIVTKETPETFYVGKRVDAEVIKFMRRRPSQAAYDAANPTRMKETGFWQCPFCKQSDFQDLPILWAHFDFGECPGDIVGMGVLLENRIFGFIPLKDISDGDVTNVEEHVQVGKSVACRITKINKQLFSFNGTCKSSDLNDENNKHYSWLFLDAYYDHEAKAKTEQSGKTEREPQCAERMISHQSFRNVSYEGCVELMKNMEQGECIIRPSSKGADHLTFTWKVTGDILQDVDVLELEKENTLSLGRILKIGDEEYEELDEILTRYVHPAAAYARDILSHRSYRALDGGMPSAAEEYLASKMNINPAIKHLVMSASAERPGQFLLSYLVRNMVRHEYITVHHEGFTFRRNLFKNISALLRWFKKRFRKPPPQHASTPFSPFNEQPMLNATPGNMIPNSSSCQSGAHFPPYVVYPYVPYLAMAPCPPIMGFPMAAPSTASSHPNGVTGSNQITNQKPGGRNKKKNRSKILRRRPLRKNPRHRRNRRAKIRN